MKPDTKALRARTLDDGEYMDDVRLEIRNGDLRAICDRIEGLEAALVVAHKHAGCADEPGSSPDVCSICKALVGA